MVLTPELRRTVESIHSPAPQPEDPERSLDLSYEEDPDIKVELIDGVFHQLSMDNALVAITADYPGLSPAPPGDCDQSPDTIISSLCISDHRIQWCLAGGTFKAGSRTRGGWPTRVSPAQQAKEECGADRNVAATV